MRGGFFTKFATLAHGAPWLQACSVKNKQKNKMQVQKHQEMSSADTNMNLESTNPDFFDKIESPYPFLCTLNSLIKEHAGLGF